MDPTPAIADLELDLELDTDIPQHTHGNRVNIYIFLNLYTVQILDLYSHYSSGCL